TPTSITSPISRKHQKNRSDHTPSPRIQREKSASASANDRPRTSEAWYLEPNIDGNGCLKNAADSLGD
ncbi:glycosyltransferase family 20 protein, partial [Laccaria amethystina LaAM-08-1]